jgi:hypothetical protein
MLLSLEKKIRSEIAGEVNWGGLRTHGVICLAVAWMRSATS